ncbi:MAG: methyl-accepting chemotaxis protein [Janthinobacterium lividum]
MFKNLRLQYLEQNGKALHQAYAIIRFLPNGKIIDANQNFLNIFGYRIDEIKEQHHRMFVDPEYAQSQEYIQFWKNLSKGHFEADEYKCYGKDSKELWIQASYNPLFDDCGQVFSITEIATDITQRTLQNAEYKSQILAINKAQAIISFTLDGKIIDANQNFLDIFDYTLDEIKGQPHRIFVNPDYAKSEEYFNFWQQLHKGHYKTGEFKRLGKDNKEVWIQASYNPILDPTGRVLKVVKFATDVTKQKLESANTAGQLNAISKAQAIVEFNLDGNIITTNDNFLNIFGYSLPEIQNKHHSMFVEKSESESLEYSKFWKKLRDGIFDVKVYKRIGKDNKEVWIQASYNPIFDLNGKPFKVVKFATDITELIHTANLAEQTNFDVVESVKITIEETVCLIQEINKNMIRTEEATHSILEKTTLSNAMALKFVTSMTSMEKVLNLINKIASQVNLLALNASIEAAKAGNLGKGFAVVAAEIKALALQTANATSDIAKEITTMHTTSYNVADGIKDISISAQSVNDIVTNVATAMRSQNTLIKKISEDTQKTSRAVGQISTSIKKLLNV